ncbi:MAG: hypothetical protein QF743_02885 [Candidatus Marinimicrobia bacterium]|jgi:hypothetical protein|nr:hypothetical protein [Candidatus Neomarinimicrobiota bacterium]|tara:strand:+ start:6544 stop:7065 length:522 start_codon:yes stop_codon:yes gene_type:complete
MKEKDNSAKKDTRHSKTLKPCCNNLLPKVDAEGILHSITYCEGGQPDPNDVIGWDCGTYWTHLVLLTDDELFSKACEVRPITIKPVDSLTGENYKGKSRLTWSFVYGHGYVIKKKVGSGDWETIKEIDDRDVEVWRDENQSLPPSDKIYYRVYTKLFYSIADSAPEVCFNPQS